MGLMINGQWVTHASSIKLESWRFFKNKFHEQYQIKPQFINHNFKKLDIGDRNFLEEPFELNEIKEAIWNCGSEKASGPDALLSNLSSSFGILCKMIS